MPKLQFDIPQTEIDKAAGKELESAKRRIKTLEAKVVKLESQEREAKRALMAFDRMREFMADNYDLYRDYGF